MKLYNITECLNERTTTYADIVVDHPGWEPEQAKKLLDLFIAEKWLMKCCGLWHNKGMEVHAERHLTAEEALALNDEFTEYLAKARRLSGLIRALGCL